MSAVVDMRNFQAAFKEYLGKTSKTMEEAVNWKAADLMLTAARHTPKTNLTQGELNAMRDNPRLISYRTGRRFGDANGRGWTRSQWDAVRNSTRILGKGFMRSAFVKAVGKIPRTKKGRRMSDAAIEGERLTKSRANVRVATGTITSMAAQLTWQAHSGSDAGLKQDIVDKAIQKAVPEITASMVAYLRGENTKNARSVSA